MLRVKSGYTCGDLRAIKEEMNYNNRQIGDKLGVSPQQIGYLLKGDLRRGLNKKYTAAITTIIEGMAALPPSRPPMNEIEKIVDVKPFEPRTIFDLKKEELTPVEIRFKIAEMTKRGFRSAEISKDLGLSVDSVRAYMANETRREKKLKAGLVKMKEEMAPVVPVKSEPIRIEDPISPLAQSVLKMLTGETLRRIAVAFADEIRDALLKDDAGLRRIRSQIGEEYLKPEEKIKSH